jgi:hypothetical protein
VRVPRDLRRASRRFFSSSSFEDRIDLTAGTKADCRGSAKPPGESRRSCAHLSAVSAALLQRGRLQLSKPAGADALAARLARRLARGQGSRRFERAIREQPVGNVLFAVRVRHGRLLAWRRSCVGRDDSKHTEEGAIGKHGLCV